MNKAAKIAAPLVILALGVLGAGGLIASGSSAEKTVPEAVITAVDVLEVQPVASPAEVQATGVVRPDKEVTVFPQVSGQIVSISPALVPGGRLAAGEVIAQIDPRDYSLTVRQEESRVAQAQVEYQLEEGRQTTAQREWALLGDGRAASEAPLALRSPQKEASVQSLASAQAGLERAQLSLYRTSLSVPFNAMVISEGVDVGQVVSGATNVARLVGTDRFRVEVAVPFEQLRALDIPGVTVPQGQAGSPATVVQTLPGGHLEREGEVLSLSGELDPQTRNAKVIVAINDPLDITQGGLPLLPGAFVDITLHGNTIASSYIVPRAAIHDGDRVWTVDSEGRLDSVEVTTRWGDAENLIVTSGLSPGDKVVVSPLSRPIEGAPVRATNI